MAVSRFSFRFKRNTVTVRLNRPSATTGQAVHGDAIVQHFAKCGGGEQNDQNCLVSVPYDMFTPDS